MSSAVVVRWWAGLLSCGVLLLAVSWAVSAPQPAGEGAEGAEGGEVSEGAETPEVDPFAVPEGTAEELLEFIEGLRGQRPKSYDQEGLTAFRKRLGTALTGAADKILAQEATEEQAELAVRYKITGLGMLRDAGETGAAAKLEKLPAELKEAGRSQLARIAQGSLLQSKLRSYRPGGNASLRELIDAVRAHLEEAPPGRNELSLAMTAAQAAEYMGGPELAAEAYGTLGKILGKSEDQQVASFAQRMEGAARRLSLVGNEMRIEGVTLDGKPFCWEDFQGKVVLVDFWATWCGPCIAEMRHIRENYELYHDRGFEVIGVSVDEDLDALAAFVEKNQVPWTVLADNAPKPEGTIPSLGDYYGVFGIPTLVLIGSEGKVVALNLGGPRLRAELEKLLGPVEEVSGESPADEASGEEAEAETG